MSGVVVPKKALRAKVMDIRSFRASTKPSRRFFGLKKFCSPGRPRPARKRTHLEEGSRGPGAFPVFVAQVSRRCPTREALERIAGGRPEAFAHDSSFVGKNVMTTPRPNRPLQNVHRFAVFTAVCTFGLLVAGALVTSNDAGLSVPDWPLSYGSLTPPMVGGIFYEHGHRMIASFVGMLSIVLAVWLWRVSSSSPGPAGPGTNNKQMAALARRGRAGRHHRAGIAGRPHRAVFPSAGRELRSRHAGANLLCHRGEHRAVYQRLVGTRTPALASRLPHSFDSRALYRRRVRRLCAIDFGRRLSPQSFRNRSAPRRSRRGHRPDLLAGRSAQAPFSRRC